MPVKTTAAPKVTLKIAGGREIGVQRMIAFEWKAFVNHGYVVRGKVIDPYFRVLKEVAVSQQYLSQARQAPTEIKFKIAWDGDPELETEERTAYISDLDQYGKGEQAQFEFVAVDPASWMLNAGDGNGKVYKGNITKVIKDVVSDYAANINVQVTETEDDKNGLWPMMRQDPKSFIQSMLDWSANLNPQKTHWLTVSKDFDLHIKEQADLLANKTHFGHYNLSFDNKRINDVQHYTLLTNNFLSVFQNSVITQGISTISGKFIDKKTDNEKVEIRDENTGNKINARIDSKKGFSKPQCKWATSINAIPEHSAGEIGVKYEDYVGGRARNLYLNMLPMVMRVRIGIDGDKKFDDPTKLGVSTININWKDEDNEDYFLSGRWIVYGFHHKVTRKRWVTDLYLYRIDHNANARPI
jgi:hypothetical protein